VRRVIEPLLTDVMASGIRDGDAEYVHDLGLIAFEPALQLANPIYGDAIVRFLGVVVENGVELPSGHFLGADGRLDLPEMLRAFAVFWQEHGAELAPATIYQEAAPQLALVAYLHRIANGTALSIASTAWSAAASRCSSDGLIRTSRASGSGSARSSRSACGARGRPTRSTKDCASSTSLWPGSASTTACS
jgi:hypothetical protein